MKFTKIRNLNYKRSNIRHNKEYGINLNDWFRNPYSSIKSKLLIEISSLVVFTLQKTKISPNFLTILNSFLVLIAGYFVAFCDNDLKIIGILIFFSQGILDWADGLLATIKKRTSDIGYILDPWSGLLNYNIFIISIGLYLFNQLNSDIFLFLIIIYLCLRYFDLRNYSYMFVMYEKANDRIKGKKKKKSNNSIKKNSILNIFKNIIQNIFNDRSHWIDTVLFIILLELYFDRVILAEYIFYIIIFNNLLIFLGGFYLCFFKNFISSLINSVKIK
tara:strand:- start:35 stop:859 length:825 start_codon:yes stop_codon:yes gene_type:complete